MMKINIIRTNVSSKVKEYIDLKTLNEVSHKGHSQKALLISRLRNHTKEGTSNDKPKQENCNNRYTCKEELQQRKHLLSYCI